MKEQDKKLLMYAVLIILAFFVIRNLPQQETFGILYQGEMLEGAETNITGECWTLGADNCVRQEVNMVNLTVQGILICPEAFYPTEKQCEKGFNLVEEPKPVTCFQFDEDVGECVEEEFLETCPSGYNNKLSICQNRREEFTSFSATTKRIFSDNKSFIVIVGGVLVGIILLILKLRK